jgi:CDP-glucose 4,6-dehydratase
MDGAFWMNKRVLVTGHTGFKGSWLCMWLASMGAEVTGYALSPPTIPSLYGLCGVHSIVHSNEGDVRDKDRLRQCMMDSNPDIVIHMAAQPLVRASYLDPLTTFETNVMGTANLLDAVRHAAKQGKAVRCVVNVTTDKCYENKEWHWGYREMDSLGGYDPYSNSKACSELLTASYRSSFFLPAEYSRHGVALATARAGNVIGGGDWAADRLIPDFIRSLMKGESVTIRNPRAIRPWQHVLEPLGGYLLLAQRLYEKGPSYGESWNFGPHDPDAREVEWVVGKLCAKWGQGADYVLDASPSCHEAYFLKLDCSKARARLGWEPRWSLEHALDKVAEWYKAYLNGGDMKAVCINQIKEYSEPPGRGD